MYSRTFPITFPEVKFQFLSQQSSWELELVDLGVPGEQNINRAKLNISKFNRKLMETIWGIYGFKQCFGYGSA